MKTKLIKNFSSINKDSFGDCYILIAKNIEDSLLEAGAVAGKDYTMLDLYTLAQPFVLEMFKGEKDLFMTAEWHPD